MGQELLGRAFTPCSLIGVGGPASKIARQLYDGVV